MHAVRFFDGAALREGSVVPDATGPRLIAAPAPEGSPRLEGIVTGLFTDHHVHLQLVDAALLGSSRLGRVIDLGAEPSAIRVLRRTAAAAAAPPAHAVVVDHAGPFLTAPGGYPSDRPWAPEGSVVELRDAAHAVSVVDGLADAGAVAIKAVAHSVAGPLLDDALFRAIVRTAETRGLAVVAHAEGAEQAERVVALGAATLAHAPFTEPLDDHEIAVQAASASWISTLAIHEGAAREIAIDNVRRFAAAGGVVRYGTDMGNGPGPVDLRVDEVAALREAGIDGEALLRALAPGDPTRPGAPLLLLPEGDPARARILGDDETKD